MWRHKSYLLLNRREPSGPALWTQVDMPCDIAGADAAAAAAAANEVKAVQEDENEEDEEGLEETALAAAASPVPQVAPRAKAKRSVQWSGKALDSNTSGGTKFYRSINLPLFHSSPLVPFLMIAWYPGIL